MPDLLLELFCEEIPARMQRRAAEDLQKLVTDALVDAGLVYEGAKAFATPRRLALTVHGVPARSPDQREERKGPRVGAPDKAIEGFLRGAGLDIDRAGDGAAGQEGRCLCRRDREARPPGARGHRRIHARHHARPSPGRSRCAGAEARPMPAASPGCGRCIPSSASSAPRPSDTEVVPFEVDGLKSGDIDLRPSLHGAGADRGEALRRLCDQAGEGEGRARCRPAQGDDPRRCAQSGAGARPRTDRGRGAARRGRRAGRMAGGPHRRLRRGVSWKFRPRSSAPPSAPTRNASCSTAAPTTASHRAADRAARARQPLRPGRQYRGQRRRQGDHRRQRARHPRPPGGRPLFLGDRPQDHARTAPAQARRDRLPREARHAGAARQAPRCGWRARSPRWCRPTPSLPSAPPSSPRPIWSPRWSASSRNCRA